MIIVSVLVFLIILTIIVSINEAGHFLTAKKFGVYCREFAIGMGPKIWQKQKGETNYSIRAIPMGGFVQMIGEDGELFAILPDDHVWLTFDAAGKVKQIFYNEPNGPATAVKIVKFEKAVQPIKITYIENEVEKIAEGTALIECFDSEDEEQYVVANNRQFNYLHPLKKIVVLTAGVVLNFVLGFVVVFAATWITGVNVNPIIATDSITDEVSEHFQVGDEIIAINGIQFSTLDEMTQFIRSNPNEEVEVSISRNDEVVTVQRKTLEIEAQELTTNGIIDYKYGALGVTYQRNHIHIGKIFMVALSNFIGFFQYVYFVLVGLFAGHIKITNLTGFVGIAQQTNAVITSATAGASFFTQAAEVSGRVLNFMAFLSVNIGVMNILPFPALDGGRVVFAVYELIFRRKPNPKFETYLNAFGFILLIGLFIAVTYLDIKRLLGF